MAKKKDTGRRSVTVVLGSLDDGMPLDELEAQIAEARKRAAAEEIVNLVIDIQVDRGYYGDIDGSTLRILGSRPETDEEMAQRQQSEQAQAQYSEAQERAQYERLRQKFESR